MKPIHIITLKTTLLQITEGKKESYLHCMEYNDTRYTGCIIGSH